MSGRDERLDRRREALERPGARASSRSDERERRASFRNATRRSPITTTSFGWTMWSSRVEPGRGVGRVLGAELEAVRAVDGQRVDVEPLQRLEERLAGAAEERDALLDLRRLRART